MLKSGLVGPRPSAEHAVDREPCVPAHRLEVRAHDGIGEMVVTRRYRRVRRERRARRNGLERGLEAPPRARQLAHALDDQERGVSLVDVPDDRLEAERAQRARTAHAEQHLLLEPQIPSPP